MSNSPPERISHEIPFAHFFILWESFTYTGTKDPQIEKCKMASLGWTGFKNVYEILKRKKYLQIFNCCKIIQKFLFR